VPRGRTASAALEMSGPAAPGLGAVAAKVKDDRQEDLEQLFGRSVDLVPKEGLHRVLRDQVLADAQVPHAA
jgi:hypothetical protein